MWCDGVWADGIWADGVWPYYGTNEPEPEPETQATRRRKKRCIRIPDDAWEEIIGKKEEVTIILG